MEKELEELIDKARQKDEQAFQQLYDKTYGKFYAIAIRICHNEADAKDALQETFASVYEHLPQLRENAYYYAWVRKILISKCNKMFRRQRPMAMDPLILQETQVKERRKGIDVEETIDYENEKEVLRVLMQKMKPKHREVLELIYLKQMHVDEAARYLNVPEGTIKSRSKRAREELHEIIKEFEKSNQRKLHFQGELLSAGVASGGLWMHLHKTKGFIKKCFTANPLSACCSASLCVLAISGGAFVLEDSMQNKLQDVHTSQTLVTENMPIQNFQSVAYEGKQITDARTAYYTCLNFAIDEEAMQKKTEEERQAIQPVYESIKKQNATYWNLLQEEGWVELFEKYKKE